MILYGISQCDTVKKARAWLKHHHLFYTFHDFKKTPPTMAMLERWINKHGWEALINKRGTTWRNLTENQRAELVSKEQALQILLQYSSLIKRPILETNDIIYIGFTIQTYQALLLS